MPVYMRTSHWQATSSGLCLGGSFKGITFMSEWKDFIAVLRMMQYRFFVENQKFLDAVLAGQRANPLK